ncbi:phosphorylase family protein [Streptomyces acidiscabies]|uniref:phosphorylase family protein n=1 Tax=Streptomyces acidiscabies TaxID=42234 RepID=UPI00095293B3|nr:hypothetical protein [Streptomyces acidiscabies]
MSEPSPLAIVLTALPEECTAILTHLTDVEERVHRGGSRVQLGRLRGSRWRLAVAELGEGSERTAAAAAQLVEWLTSEAPCVLAFVGVAEALTAEVGLGDIVVATKVYAVHGGKEGPDGEDVRPEAWFPSHPLIQAARSALRGSTGVHLKPIAVGDVVLTAKDTPLGIRLRKHFNDAVAMERESSGLLHAAHVNEPLCTLVVRGIGDASGSQKRAAQAAADAAVTVLMKYEPPDQPDRGLHPQEGPFRRPACHRIRTGSDHRPASAHHGLHRAGS